MKDKRKVKLNKIKCEKCGYTWTPLKEIVNNCANKKCRSPKWYKARK